MGISIRIKRETFLRRLLRVMEESGYTPADLLNIQPVELAEIEGITVPEIRFVLSLQSEVLGDLQNGDAILTLLEQCGW